MEWWLADLFAPSSSPSTSRVIDQIALQLRLGRFCLDATNAFNHVPETEDIFVEPAAEWLESEAAAGRRTDVVWKLEKVLYGCRRGVQKWVSWFAELLMSFGFLRCDVAPQFFYDPTNSLYLEVHIDDVHGCGRDADVEVLVELLREYVSLKFSGMVESGKEYCHLKRPRVCDEAGCWIGMNQKYVTDLLNKLRMSQCKESPTPSTATGGGEDETALELDQ
eukprot:3917089-Amphidinium_carterae.1